MSVTRTSSWVLHSAAVPLHSTAAAAICDWRREETLSSVAFGSASALHELERPSAPSPISRRAGKGLALCRPTGVDYTARSATCDSQHGPFETGQAPAPLVSKVPSSS